MDQTLTAETGRPTGSRRAGRLRREGRIPGVVYGLGRDPEPVTVEWAALRRALTTEAGLNALIRLEVGGRTDLTIVKDIQRHPVRRDVLHVDFLRVDAGVEVEVEVPVVTVGEAKAVEQARGIVEHHLKSVTVMARPADIPNEVVADVSSLAVGGSILVGDLPLPSGVTATLPSDTVVIAGVATRFTEQGDAEDAPADETAAEPDEGDAGS